MHAFGVLQSSSALTESDAIVLCSPLQFGRSQTNEEQDVYLTFLCLACQAALTQLVKALRYAQWHGIQH